MTRALATHRRPARKGNTFVEGALVLSVTMFTLIGIVDVGQVLLLHQGLAERVRAGARYAVVNPYNTTNIRNVVLYNTPTPGQNPQALLSLTASMVTVTRLGAGTPEERLKISITNYPYRFFTPWLARAYTARPISLTIPIEDLS